ncbi:MAG: zinc ribbon domain-containing protein [Clostridia bacterium]|nr:zinc ribbon domain-containing protein [Clostridia bacterium]
MGYKLFVMPLGIEAISVCDDINFILKTKLGIDVEKIKFSYQNTVDKLQLNQVSTGQLEQDLEKQSCSKLPIIFINQTSLINESVIPYSATFNKLYDENGIKILSNEKAIYLESVTVPEESEEYRKLYNNMKQYLNIGYSNIVTDEENKIYNKIASNTVGSMFFGYAGAVNAEITANQKKQNFALKMQLYIGIYLIATRFYKNWINEILERSKKEWNKEISLCIVDEEPKRVSNIAFSTAAMVEKNFSIKSFVVSKEYYQKYKNIISEQAKTIYFSKTVPYDPSINHLAGMTGVQFTKQDSTYYIYNLSSTRTLNNINYLTYKSKTEELFPLLRSTYQLDEIMGYIILVKKLKFILFNETEIEPDLLLKSPCQINLYRDKCFTGCAITHTIELNGKVIGKLSNNSHLVTKTSVCDNTIKIKAYDFREEYHFIIQNNQDIEIHYYAGKILPEKTIIKNKDKILSDNNFKYCPQCGEQVKMGSNFCAKCGKKVTN